MHRWHYAAGVVIASQQGGLRLRTAKVEREGLFLIRLRLLLGWQFHDKAVQQLGQTLLVVVGLLGGYVDGLQSGAILECAVFFY